MSEPAGLLAALLPVMAAAPDGPVGVAVSGGSDSLALLLLLERWSAATGRGIAAVTIDHRLRPESAAEAAAVAALCAARGIPHHTLAWQDREPRGNLQARAREARRELIGGWARGRGMATAALGHTLDDQAEGFLLRLARGSGVDGLAGMAAVTRAGGVTWLRPLLGVRRAALRDWLTAEGVAWAEDSANTDPRFDRVRARAALEPLARLGLRPERLAATAVVMRRARVALELAVADLARRCVEPGVAGDLVLDPAPLRGVPEEIRLRLLAGALCWVSGAAYRPRLARLEPVANAVSGGDIGHGRTLHGCVLRPRRDRMAIRREPLRVAPAVPMGARRWDGRWELVGDLPEDPGLCIGSLGAAGLAACPDWRDAGLAREALLTTPAVWRGGALVAAPLLRDAPGLEFRRISAVPPPWEPPIVR